MHNNWEHKRRIINVSNRLPVKITTTDGIINYQSSEGGLSTGLSSVFKDTENIWMGWPGVEIDDDTKQKVTSDLGLMRLHPVFLTGNEIAKFYEGFSNETIWPLFHYFPTYSSYDPDCWQVYQSVNEKFADEIAKLAKPDDVIWIHDYHLMLLPEMVRTRNPNITIGYFQHIPFPSYEVFRALPWKKEIVSGLLGADVLGFQTSDDSRHFTAAVSTLTDLDVKESNIQAADGRTVKVEAHPISIDYKKYSELAADPLTEKYVQKLQAETDTKIIVSIDRLDYSKGIIQRLKAFDTFLAKFPNWQQRVTYIHLIVPSRDTVRKYKELKEEMNRLISDINGKYATLNWQPIHHFYRSFPPNILSALYKAADMALVTPLIDGMNLVSKEYVASNLEQKGVLLLSECAGAAKELSDALMVNPHDTEDYALKINAGLTMPEDERTTRMQSMQAIIKGADIFQWSKRFITSLLQHKPLKRSNLPVPINSLIRQKIDLHYVYANKRLFLLDYDGTLVPFRKKPSEAVPDESLIALLSDLARDERNEIAIISGRDRSTLNAWLGNLPVNLVAEHGAAFKEKHQKWQTLPGLDSQWKASVCKVLEEISATLPGSFVEEKSYSVAWHYRMADAPLSEELVRTISDELDGLLVYHDLDILYGNKVVEVKCRRINKGNAALHFIDKERYDFIMAIGDDHTDEDIFRVLPRHSYSIKIGANTSRAFYTEKSYVEVRNLLREVYNTATRQLPGVQLAS